MNDNNIHIVFSVCLRFYTHRIAIKLKHETNCKWVPFWLDPYSNRQDNVSKYWRRSAEKLEKTFLDEADKFYSLPEVFHGSRLIATCREKYVPFEIPYLENRHFKTSTNNIIYAGGFIKGVRDPEPVLVLLLAVLDAIDKDLLFHFYVRNKEKYRLYEVESKGRISFHDYVSHLELENILGRSKMLLSIGNNGSVQMPSKTVEYVSYRKPLLFFYKDRSDASLRYLSNYPDICRICVDDELDDNRKKIIDFMAAVHRPITYESLMHFKEFRESTPEYIRSQIDL